MLAVRMVSIGLIAVAVQAAAPVAAHEIRETNPRYRIAFEYPQLAGQPRLNSAVRRTIDPIVEGFSHDMAQPVPPGAPRSEGYLEGKYKAATLKSGVVSVLITWQQYTPGAAHPSEGMASINYDARSRRLLTLSDLFDSGSDYVTRLSQMAIESLTHRQDANIDLIQQGAGPVENNFKVFTLTDSTLVLHFPTYQVGTRVDGPQEVAIPLDRLTHFTR